MITKKEYIFEKLKKAILSEKELLKELGKFVSEIDKKRYDASEKTVISARLENTKEKIRKLNQEISNILKGINLVKNLDGSEKKEPLKKENSSKVRDPFKEKKLQSQGGKTYKLKELRVKGLERETIKRLRKRIKKEKIPKKKAQKQSKYSEVSSKVFSKLSKQLLGKDSFKELEQNLIRANLEYSPTGYISLILFSTLISTIVGGFVFLFFLFFNVEAIIPFITRTVDPINIRFLKVFWLLFTIPVGTFVMMFLYPSLEKKSSEFKIDIELPFATIHMAAISGSMLNPIKIFEIILSTKEYPALEREFTKLLNEINIYGSDFVSALKNTAKNTSSKKLSELLNGLATTINSGGNLPDFFEKRSQTLLFEYRILREKATKAAETFMDIYISVVIAAPMILMLLLMMMKISGLGLSASVSTIALMMILGVTVINIIFLTFLHLKKQQ